jgi:WD40 repeat protein
LFCYDIGDAETFFGRDVEIAECMRRLETAGMLAVVGPSGSGKSSLIRAGVAAALAGEGRRPFVVTAGSRPTIVLTDTPSTDTVLIVDQFEEVFTLCTDLEERDRFFAGLVVEASSCPVVISLRADHLGGVAQYPEIARLVERGLYLLGPMDEAGLRAAITGPAESAGLLLEPGLVDLLVREVEGRPGALPLLSHALRRTWERREGRTLTVAGYQATGGIRGSVAQSAEQLYESLTARQQELLRQVLLRLVSAANQGDPVRTRVLRRLLLTDPEREDIVERLVAARLVTADGETVQIAHESLARAWPRLVGWLEEDVEGQRILRHLSASADAWDGMGRPDSELYRGARLTRTLDWRRTAGPDLTATESAFIDAGVAVRDGQEWAAEQQARQQVRTRRRTRVLVTGVAGLLIVALVAGLVAMRQQQQREAADLAAVVAEASRVDEASHNAPDVVQALLLALEANRRHDSPETRAVLADLLSGQHALIRSLSVPNPVQSLAVSPDGATLMVGEGDRGIDTYSTDTYGQTDHSDLPGWVMNYRADGHQLLFAGTGQNGLTASGNSLPAAVTVALSSRLDFLQLILNGDHVSAGDAAYSGNDSRIAAYGYGLDGGNVTGQQSIVDSAVAVWDTTAPQTPIMTLRPMPSFAVALSPDGRTLYVGTQRPALTAISVPDGRVLNSIPLLAGTPLLPKPADVSSIWDALSDTIEVSPDGKTLAVAEGNDVVLYDAATLSELRRLRRHSDLVRSLRFSPDGTMLATGSDDHTARVWNVALGAEIYELTGHTDAVLAVAFAPDGGTLDTGGLDRHVLVWDLTGRRQFATRIVDEAPPDTHIGVAVPAPDGRTVVDAGSSASEKLRFLDVATGQPGAAIIDSGADPLATWLPDDARVLTVAGRDLHLWDGQAGQIVADGTVAGSGITALAATADGAFAVVGERDGSVRRVETRALAAAGRRVRLDHAVTAVAPGAGATAVALLDDKSYAVVDLADGTVLRQGSLGIKPSAAAISPDGHRLAVGGSTGEVGMLDLDSQEWITAPAVAHRQFVDSISFAADGATFVTASYDGGVRLWDGTNGAQVAGVRVGEKPSSAAAVLPPDGQAAIIATSDGAVYRLPTGFDQWRDFACTVAGRNLTTVEWQTVFGNEPHRDTCAAG